MKNVNVNHATRKKKKCHPSWLGFIPLHGTSRCKRIFGWVFLLFCFVFFTLHLTSTTNFISWYSNIIAVVFSCYSKKYCPLFLIFLKLDCLYVIPLLQQLVSNPHSENTTKLLYISFIIYLVVNTDKLYMCNTTIGKLAVLATRDDIDISTVTKALSHL